MPKHRLLRTLFFVTLRLSASTFGGGWVIVPLMRKYFVEEKQWLSEDEMLNCIALSQAAPGPIAVNAALIVGANLAGFWGAMVCLVGTVLPPLITISVLSLLYASLKSNHAIALMLEGMQAAVAAILVNVTADLSRTAYRQLHWAGPAITLAAFAAQITLRIHVFYLLLAGVALSFLLRRFTPADSPGEERS